MFFSKKKEIDFLRSIWGKRVDKYRNYDLIASYHNLLPETDPDSVVDDKTWNDLNLESVFSKMDRNLTGTGSQYLYHLLHKYEKDEKVLKKRFALISHLKTGQSLREEIQLKLSRLNKPKTYFIPHVILSSSLPHMKFYQFLYLLAALPVVMLVLMNINSAFFLGLVGSAVINILLNYFLAENIYDYFAGFSGLNSLIESALAIGRINPDVKIDEIELLKSEKALLKSLKKKLGTFVIEKEGLNELALSSIEYLNMFFLFDIIAYYRSVSVLLRYQDEMHEIYKAVAGLDSAIAIASYLTEVPHYTAPSFSHSDTTSFEEMYHPLIYNAVPNTLSGINDSVLITGSNMSGKTTFIKSVGINIVLSQTLYFALAKSFSINRCYVKTSIRRTDELEEGKSYFWIEIEELKKFIELSSGDKRYIFLIDEIFRGTNTLERLASSTAVLKYLDEKNRVFVTTHDIELQDLLENQYKMFHFSEQVEEGKFFFNYKIKSGPCTSGNAIKLLEIMGYPGAVIKEANETVKNLLKCNSYSINRNSEIITQAAE